LKGSEFLKKVFVSVVFSVLAVAVVIFSVVNLTGSTQHLLSVDLSYFALSSFCMLFSIALWAVSWNHVMRAFAGTPYKNAVVLSFCAFYGSLTPMQIGTDAVRSFLSKKFLLIPAKKAFSASLITKMMKFFLLVIAAGFSIVVLELKSPVFGQSFFTLIVGFSVILFAALVFYGLQWNSFGRRVARLLDIATPFLSRFGFSFKSLFLTYSTMYSEMVLNRKIIAFFLVFLSLLFEYLAVYFAFSALFMEVSFFDIFLFATIVNILSRVPWLPQGILLVEATGYVFLTSPSFAALEPVQVGSVIVLWDIVRLAVPLLVSLAFNVLLFGEKLGFQKEK